MAAPVFRQISSVSGATRDGTVTIDKPTGTVDNDIMLCFFYVETDNAVTPPSGWSSAVENVDNNGPSFEHHAICYWKRASSEGSNYTFTWTGNVWQEAIIISYSGCPTGESPINVSTSGKIECTSAGQTASPDQFPTLSMTTTVADCMLIYFCNCSYIWTTTTPPTDFTERGEVSEMEIAEKAQASAGGTGNVVATTTGENLRSTSAIMVALKPAVSSSSTGAVYPGSAVTASESPWSDNDWTNPGNIVSDNATNAEVTASTYDAGDQTYVLKAYNFNFSSIPDTATIVGVICRVNAYYATAVVSIDLMQLLDTSRAKVGTNQCSTPVALGTDSAGIVTKGSSSDLWGNALTPSWVKDADFGVAIGCLAGGTGNSNNDVYIDYVTLEIFYTDAAKQLDATTATFSYTAKNLTGLFADRKLSVEAKSYTYTAKDLTGLQVARKLTAQVAAFSETPKDITFNRTYLLVPSVSTFTYTPIDVGLVRGRVLAAEKSTFTYTPIDLSLLADRKLSTQVSAFTETSIDVNFNRTYVLFPSVSAFTYTPIDVIFSRGRVLNTEKSTFTLTPIDAALLVDRKLNTLLAEFDLTAINTGLLADRKLSTQVQSYVFTPIDVILTKTANKVIDAITAAFTLTAINTILKADRILGVSTSAFTYTPINVDLLRGRTLNAETQSFIETVKDVALLLDRKLNAAARSFTYTPINSELLANRILGATKSTFNYTPIDVQLQAARRLSAEKSTFTFTPIDLLLQAARKLNIDVKSFTYTPIDVLLDYSGEVNEYFLDAITSAFVLSGIDVNLLYSGAEVNGTIMTPQLRAAIVESILGSILMSPVIPASADSILANVDPDVILSSLILTPNAANVKGASFNPNALGGVPTQAAGESKGFFKF